MAQGMAWKGGRQPPRLKPPMLKAWSWRMPLSLKALMLKLWMQRKPLRLKPSRGRQPQLGGTLGRVRQ